MKIGTGKLQVKFIWNSGEVHLDSRWTLENHLESNGVHLNSVGERKVLKKTQEGPRMLKFTQGQ